MGFSSQLYPNEQVIDDATPFDAVLVPGNERGLTLPMGHSPDGGNYGDLAKPFPQELLIPSSEWQAWIQESEERKTRVSDLINQVNLPEKDQNGIPYCWIFGPVQCVEVTRCIQGQPYISLSPASAGAPIKNFRAVGGWGKEGLEYIVQHGLVPSSLWPDTAVNRKYWTEDNKKVALDYRVQEWYELKPRNLNEMVSLLLRRQVAAVGYNWWSHEVMAVEVVWLDGTVALRIRNQWKGYGDKNFAILKGSRMLPDDIVAPTVAIAA